MPKNFLKITSIDTNTGKKKKQMTIDSVKMAVSLIVSVAIFYNNG